MAKSIASEFDAGFDPPEFAPSLHQSRSQPAIGAVIAQG
jgi:hypothetical protein